MTRMTGLDWLARMTVMTGTTGMTGMTEIEQIKQGTIMQMWGAVVSVKQLNKIVACWCNKITANL